MCKKQNVCNHNTENILNQYNVILPDPDNKISDLGLHSYSMYISHKYRRLEIKQRKGREKKRGRKGRERERERGGGGREREREGGGRERSKKVYRTSDWKIEDATNRHV